MSDKSDLKAELERKKQRLAQIREEKKRKEEERKKKEVNMQKRLLDSSCLQKGLLRFWHICILYPEVSVMWNEILKPTSV